MDEANSVDQLPRKSLKRGAANCVDQLPQKSLQRNAAKCDVQLSQKSLQRDAAKCDNQLSQKSLKRNAAMRADRLIQKSKRDNSKCADQLPQKSKRDKPKCVDQLPQKSKRDTPKCVDQLTQKSLKRVATKSVDQLEQKTKTGAAKCVDQDQLPQKTKRDTDKFVDELLKKSLNIDTTKCVDQHPKKSVHSRYRKEATMAVNDVIKPNNAKFVDEQPQTDHSKLKEEVLMVKYDTVESGVTKSIDRQPHVSAEKSSVAKPVDQELKPTPTVRCRHRKEVQNDAHGTLTSDTAKSVDQQPQTFVRGRYTKEMMMDAYEAVRGGLMDIAEASAHYGIPERTLLDRVSGRVGPSSVVGSGPTRVFTFQEEKNIVDFIVTMHRAGHGYSRADIATLASQYAVHLGKRTKNMPFCCKWVSEIMKRWPELKSVYGVCKVSLPMILSNFFDRLESVMQECNFYKMSHLIFSVSDIEIRQDDPNSGEEQMLATILTCGRADGVVLPPFFVFPRQQMSGSLMKGALPGTRGTISEGGRVNTHVFKHFLKEHLVMNLSEQDRGKPVLVHVNGFKFFSVGLKDWTNAQNMFIFFPPCELSSNLMPVDVGCIEPFQALYTKECERHIQDTLSDVQVNNICEIVCKVYQKAFTSNNVKEGYRKSGLFPCNRHMLVLPKII